MCGDRTPSYAEKFCNKLAKAEFTPQIFPVTSRVKKCRISGGFYTLKSRAAMPEKTDNSTHAEIHVLSEKIDQLNKDRREDRDDHDKSQNRLQWRIGIIVALALSLIGLYLESVRRELTTIRDSITDTNTSVKQLVDKTSDQAVDIAVIREKTNNAEELRVLYQGMQSEIQELRVEVERLKRQ